MEIYGLKNCDTCRKAIKALPDATFVDVRAVGVPDSIMARAQQTFGEQLMRAQPCDVFAIQEHPT